MRNKFKYLLSLLIVFLVACSKSTSSLVDSEVCKAPCWRGMTPGITTEEDAKNLLLKMDDIDKNSITEESGYMKYWQNSIKWSFKNVDEGNGALYFHDDILVVLFSNYDRNLSLSRVISKFGNPDEVYASRMVLDSTTDTFIIYYSSGICIELNTLRIKPKEIEPKTGQFSAQITPDEKIKYIYFFDNSVSASELNTTCYWQYDQDKIQEWNGYGYYIFLMND